MKGKYKQSQAHRDKCAPKMCFQSANTTQHQCMSLQQAKSKANAHGNIRRKIERGIGALSAVAMPGAIPHVATPQDWERATLLKKHMHQAAGWTCLANSVTLSPAARQLCAHNLRHHKTSPHPEGDQRAWSHE